MRSGAHSSVFRLAGKNETWFVKIAPDLSAETERVQWLQGSGLPTPKLLAQHAQAAQQAILISGLPGVDLAQLSAAQPTQTTIEQLARALKQFHAADASQCPFKAYLPGDMLVHGDACLPNIIYKDGQLSGYVDVMDMGVGSIDVDLSAAVWSLQRNLGPGHSLTFLKEYGHAVITDDEVRRLYDLYEHSPIFER